MLLTRAPKCAIFSMWRFKLERFPVKILRKLAGKTAVASFVMASASLVTFAPSAYAVSYTTSGLSTPLTSLGDTIGSQYDQLAVGGVTGTLQTGTIVLNTLAFTAGINALVPQTYNGVYSIAETMSVDSGTPQQLTIPFNLSISYSDTLTIVGGTTLSFLDGGSLWQIVVNGLTFASNSGGTMIGYLTAQVTDPPSPAPLPAALPLFASGLGAMGLFAWWRKRKRGVVGAA